MFLGWFGVYLEGQRDLVSIHITPSSLIETSIIPIINLLSTLTLQVGIVGDIIYTHKGFGVGVYTHRVYEGLRV